jgi:OLD-like protein
VVVVEGASDQVALEVLGRRLGHDLAAAGISIRSMGGAHSIGRHLRALLAEDPAARVLGLYDAGEEDAFRRALRAGDDEPVLTREDLERLGFYACVADLEDELIRALGVAGVEEVVAAEGELQSLRRFEREPFQRQRPAEAQLRRFICTRSGRKARYARAMAAALDLDRIPRPLDLLLARLGAQSSSHEVT